MANLLELAEICDAVYDENILKNGTSVGGGWICTDYKLASGALNGFQAGVFSKSGEKVVAFRGTAQTMDGVADFKLGTGMNSTYFSEGQSFAERAGSKNAIVTGHSLGGAIAQVVANRDDYTMATFNAPGVGVIVSRNILETTITMSAIRLVGMAASVTRHPMQAASDVWNAFGVVKGINICLNNDAVSKIGNHYGKVKRIAGTGMSPISQHKISTVISVLKSSSNSNLASRTPGSF